ncbi:hypothetical protein EVAR_84984_1 [Eumeta japonica]|uniref:Uncharacterized protein n=1 Tax=Eumeta variegata TaxID=151549 RepID=A0A4C1WA50_EUMVA|nr:hypothetical protein EVAR_84984_1 [Eumeta japonica]
MECNSDLQSNYFIADQRFLPHALFFAIKAVLDIRSIACVIRSDNKISCLLRRGDDPAKVTKMGRMTVATCHLTLVCPRSAYRTIVAAQPRSPRF